MSLLPTRKLTCLWGGKKEAHLRIVTYEGKKIHLLFSLERSIYKLSNCDVQGTVGITATYSVADYKQVFIQELPPFDNTLKNPLLATPWQAFYWL